jgi:hypothetical protein
MSLIVSVPSEYELRCDVGVVVLTIPKAFRMNIIVMNKYFNLKKPCYEIS